MYDIQLYHLSGKILVPGHFNLNASQGIKVRNCLLDLLEGYVFSSSKLEEKGYTPEEIGVV